MPELPEVHTTATGLQKVLPGLKIVDVWTDYNSVFHAGKENIKNPKYFERFRKNIVGRKIINVSRRGKNVLIHLSGDKTILVHMKMTGHLMYGKYFYDKKENKWLPVGNGPLSGPKNRWIHFVIELSNKKHLSFSDMRKFAKITLIKTSGLQICEDLKNLGLEPFSKEFTLNKFKEIINMRSDSRVKQVLMDQSLIAGIGNIYSDEILWESGVHPESKPAKIPNKIIMKMFKASLKLLKRGIDFGGDSTSDYRNIYGEPGKFQHKHQAYRRKGEKCRRSGCKGIIIRKIIGGRSAHLCSIHQNLF